MTTTTESGGRQNMYPTEVQPQLVENYEGYGPNAEKLNGRLAMLGLVAGVISANAGELNPATMIRGINFFISPYNFRTVFI